MTAQGRGQDGQHSTSTSQALYRALKDGRISRRGFMVRAAALGFSATAINAFLIACGGGEPTATRGTTGGATTAAGTTARPATAATTAGTAARATATATRAAGTPAAGATATRAGSPTATRAAATYSRTTAPEVPNANDAKRFSGQRITYYGDSVGLGAELDKTLATKFQQETGIQVNVVPKPTSATENYSAYQRFFQAQSADVDVMMLDVIWPGAFAQHLLDLTPKLGELAKQCFPSIVENNTVDGKLVGMPWFGDFGMLFYRTDLLQKYQFSAPPKTWDELEQQARKIQDGERASNPNFAGFVFQGNAYEGLTCNTLEWLASSGGGRIIEGGRPTINNPQAATMLNKVKGWVGTIAPKGVTSYQEPDTQNAFTGGNAAFARNWPYMYAIGQEEAAVKGKFDVAPLPAAQGQKSAGTLGGWQLGVSRYSKAQDAAVEFVRYMCSKEVSTWRAVVGSYVPLYPDVSDNPDVARAMPFLKSLANVERVTRPSRELREQYNEGSTRVFQGVNQILNGQDAAGQLQQIDQQLQRLVRR